MKPRGSLLEPDARFANSAAGFDQSGAIRKMDITDLYDQVAEIQLHAAVPADIAEQFDKARYAYVYSWFAYELVSLAEQQGYQTLELALREKLPAHERVKADRDHWGLARLFAYAYAHGWVKRQEFVDPQTNLCLLDFVARSRNELAHGSRNLFPVGSLTMLQLVAEILNALFHT